MFHESLPDQGPAEGDLRLQAGGPLATPSCPEPDRDVFGLPVSQTRLRNHHVGGIRKGFEEGFRKDPEEGVCVVPSFASVRARVSL